MKCIQKTIKQTVPVLLAGVFVGNHSVAVTFRSGDLSVRFAPERAYTIDDVKLGKIEAGVYRGNWGLVFHPGEYKWIGTGHREGGREEVDKISVQVDGVMLEKMPAAKEEISGKRLELIKESRLHDVRLASKIIVEDGVIQEEAVLTFASGQFIQTGYAFMHCWTPDAKYWLAETVAGDVIDGELSSTAKWEVKQDLHWLALYVPENGLVILMQFPPDTLPGKGIKQAIHDHTSFRKHYFQPYAGEMMPAGRSDNFRMSTQLFTAPEEQWKTAVKNAAKCCQE
ncbi:MAG: hypothetical protein WC959_11125 [Kiritimatiellales bacterium]